MKKTFSMVLTMAMLVSVFFIFLNSGTVHASPNDSESILTILNNPTNSETPISERKFTVEIVSEHKEIGDHVIIPITFSNVPAKGIATFDMTIVYDTTQLEYVSCETGDIIINPEINFFINKAYDGLLKLLFLDDTLKNENITSDGTLVNLTFKKLQLYNESTSIKIIRSSFGDNDLNNVEPKIIQTNANIPIPTPPQIPTPTLTSTTTPRTTPTPTPTPKKYFRSVIGSVKGNTGDIVTVPVKFTNVPANGISTASMTLKYSPTLLELISVTPGDIVPAPELNFNSSFYHNSPYEGYVSLQYVNDSEKYPCISSDGVFANITFKVLCTYDRYAKISLHNYLFKDGDFQRFYDYYGERQGGIYITGIEPVPDFNIKVGSAQGSTNDLVTIPIFFLDVPDKKIGVFFITLNYDSSQLEYISYEKGNIFVDSDICFDVAKESDGKLLLLYVVDILEGNIEEDGLLANLTFKVLGSSGETSIYLSDAKVGDGFLNLVNTVLIPGKVSILPSSSGYTVSGYVYSELENNYASNVSFNEGFNVELSGTDLSALTDKNGYFEIKDVPAGTYTLKISKVNYLTREIKDFTVEKDEQLASPIILWIGDIEIDGKQDGAINMEDIMEVCKSFNTVRGDTRYRETLDLNKDNAINLEDVMIVAKHFNKTSANY